MMYDTRMQYKSLSSSYVHKQRIYYTCRRNVTVDVRLVSTGTVPVFRAVKQQNQHWHQHQPQKKQQVLSAVKHQNQH